VDLDGAFSGSSQNLEAVKKILEVEGLAVQLGGGMRDEKIIESALEMGLSRVIIGTRACAQPGLGHLNDKSIWSRPYRRWELMQKTAWWPPRAGWKLPPPVQLTLAKSLVSAGLRWIVHTDVSTDGAMQGPNLDAQREIALAVPSCNIIASGGVSCAEDVTQLRELSIECPNIEGVIIGKALYEKTINLASLII
jgi:phosphoribosylformimino-5-aminoimidazole carboxamide ribotide isomerase